MRKRVGMENEKSVSAVNPVIEVSTSFNLIEYLSLSLFLYISLVRLYNLFYANRQLARNKARQAIVGQAEDESIWATSTG